MARGIGAGYYNTEKEKALNRWANMRRTQPERDFAFAYLLWLRTGANWLTKPKPKRVTIKRAKEIEDEINSMNPLE